MPSRGTPTRESSLAQWRTPSKVGQATLTKSTGKAAADRKAGGLLPWIQPVTRFLCNETDHKKLSPTIVAGMESITAPGAQHHEDEWISQNITPLFAAIYFFVIMRVKALASGETVDREGYVPQRKEILGLLTRARTEVTIKGVDEDDAWEGWTNIKSKDFDNAVAQVNERGLLSGDWYHGISDVVKLTQRTHADDIDMLDDEDVITTVQVRRADTMFQDKYDFLSTTRREDYKVWKKNMLAKIDQLAATGTAMEVDA